MFIRNLLLRIFAVAQNFYDSLLKQHFHFHNSV